MKMPAPEIYPQFTHLISGLKDLDLAYVHLVESRVSGSADIEATEKIDPLLEIWGKEKPVLLAGGFKPDSAKRAVEDEYPDYKVGIVFGRYYISNPDLAFRILQGVELEPYDRSKFYDAGNPVGYIDYPYSKEFEAARSHL